MIHVDNITFSYDKETVLDELSFTELEPVITGLWGRNGSGKTTLMKLLAGYEEPEHGKIEIQGKRPYNNAEAVQNVCYMQEEHPFSSIWNVHDALRFGKYFNPNWDQEMSERLLKTFRLDRKKKITKLSTGMKSALQFIIGICSNAEITILDEPVNGLDAGMRKKMYKVLRESHEENPRLILLTSHHIGEIQSICEKIIVIKDGNIMFHEPIDETRENGIWLSGTKDILEEIISDEKILEKETMSSTMKVMLDAPYSKEWKEIAHSNGLSIEKAELQDYLLNMTEDEEVIV